MEILRPASLDEAISLLKADDSLKLLAGGTDLIPRLNQQLERHEKLCLIGHYPEMTGIRKKDGRIFIGASTKLSEISQEPLLASFKALQYAASHAASPQIRNQATIGGNVLQENRCMYFNNQIPWSDVNRCFKWGGHQCYQYPKSRVCMALFQSDIAPVLIAYGAAALIRGSGGERKMPVADLYLPGGRKNLSHDEILTGIEIPEAGGAHRCAYVRWTLRGSFDFPLLGCAVSLNISDKTVTDCRIVFGAAGVRPVRFEAGEAAFEGKTVSELKMTAKGLHGEAAKKIMGFKDTHVDENVRKEKAGWLLEDAMAVIAG